MKRPIDPASDRPTLRRRKLLGAAGTTGALAAAATVLATRQESSDTADSAAQAQAPVQGGGYRVTEHVLRYYQTTKV
jgi:hypothetical protein